MAMSANTKLNEDPVTNLYRHDYSAGTTYPSRWSLFNDSNQETKHLEELTADLPILHRHIKQDDTWVTESITIQSPAMKAHLGKALDKYPDFDADCRHWEFKPPYQPILHRWDRLNAMCDAATDPSAKEAASALMKFLRPLLEPKLKTLAHAKETGKTTFEDMWQLFPPGELVVTKFFDVECVCRVTRSKIEDPDKASYFNLHFEYLTWDGESCGYVEDWTTINSFKGHRKVLSLSAYPLNLSPSASEIKGRFIERGRKFETLRGYHLQTCVGTKILMGKEEHEERPVSGRVVIDAFAYYRMNDIETPDMRAIDNAQDEDDDIKSLDSDGTGSEGSAVIETADGYAMSATKIPSSVLARSEKLGDLTEEECLITTPWVIGMDLATKEWAQFCIDEIKPVEWNDAAYDHLVLPGNEKELAWAFIKNKRLPNNDFDDFIPEKGRGIIVLMFGPPGVGKTFTAEAVSERAQAPLYSISAATLGTDATEVKNALEKALNLCTIWNAMLLLDEADIFMAARTDEDIARNELVAVFLTKLEYYQGICFLTTNRMSSLDHAFQSRVDLFLPYMDLTAAARRRVWESFIGKAGGPARFDVSAADLDLLAAHRLNGREIKNLVKSAHLLSLDDEPPARIGMSRLKMLCENRVRALEMLAEHGSK